MKRHIFKIALIQILIGQTSIAQQKINCVDRIMNRIDVLCAYVSQIDSDFVKKHRIKELTLLDCKLKDSALHYERPFYTASYNETGKQLYIQEFRWFPDKPDFYYKSTLSNYNDSTIHVQLIKSGSSPEVYKNIFKVFKLNDSLVSQQHFNYEDDSLVKFENLGIFDTWAERRGRQAAMKRFALQKDNVPAPAINKREVDAERRTRTCEPDDRRTDIERVKKDNLGRIVVIENYIWTRISENEVCVPHSKTLIEYLDSSAIIKRYSLIYTYDQKYFTSVVTGPGFYDWPKDKVHPTISYDFNASGFLFGIPQSIVITHYGDRKNCQFYKLKITTW